MVQEYLDSLKSEGNIDSNYVALSMLRLDDLLKVDENGITYLEYFCKKKVYLSSSKEVCKEIKSNFDALCICAKNGYFEYFDSFPDENIVFQEIEPGVKLIDYLIEHKVKLSYSFFDGFKNNTEIIDYALKPNVMKENHISSSIVDKLITLDNEVFLADKYIENDTIKELICKKGNISKVFDYCNEKNDYSLLKYADEKTLERDIQKGYTVLDFLLDKNIEPVFAGYHFTSNKILDILIKRNRYDLLYHLSTNKLFEKTSNGELIIDQIIEKQKAGLDCHLEYINYNISDSHVLAYLLVKLAENDMIGYVPSITPRMLLSKYNGDIYSVLEILLNEERELTIQKILPACPKIRDEKVALILRNLGIDDAAINIQPEIHQYSDSFMQKYNNSYSSSCISSCPELIQELYDLFNSDGKSDPGLVDCLVSSYVYLTDVSHPNKDMFIEELKQIIAVKKQNFNDFYYEKVIEGAYFDGKKVVSSNDIIGTINHETGHALHKYLSDYYFPEEYDRLIEKARNDESLIQRVKEYSEKYTEIREKIKSRISDGDISKYYEDYYKDEKRLELSMKLSKSKEDKKKDLLPDYNEQVLDTILAGTYSVDEFIKQKTQIEVRSMTDAMLRNYYDSLIAIGDIIDAIYNGKYKNGVLYDGEGKPINSAYGHGIDYYYGSSTLGFKEMVANYASIIKSKYSKEMIDYLRYIVGNEIVDMIKDVYENHIINSKLYADIQVEEESANAR